MNKHARLLFGSSEVSYFQWALSVSGGDVSRSDVSTCHANRLVDSFTMSISVFLIRMEKEFYPLQEDPQDHAWCPNTPLLIKTTTVRAASLRIPHQRNR
jgi:hypothetical protein